MYWLGIDIGTGGSRALLVDERGAVKASFTAAHEDMRMERPLWAEQRPENWWDAAQEAIRGVLRGAGGESRMSTRNRAVRPDAWAHAARCEGRSDSSRADLVRSAQPGAGGSCEYERSAATTFWRAQPIRW